MKDSLRKAVALLMAILMVTTCLPLSALAEIIDVSRSVQPGARLMSILPDETAVMTYVFKGADGEDLGTQIVKNGDTLYAPKSPEREGYRFMGWFDGENHFTAFGVQSGITQNQTVTLTARMQEVHYVFFVDQNDRVVTTREGVGGDEIAADATFPVGADESITGWYLDSALTQKVTSVTLENANVTLYPKVEKGHWIVFDSNNGSYIEPEFVQPNTATVMPEAPTRLGYNFAGWYNGADAFAFGGELTASVTLTAKWTARADTKYTVIHWYENANDDGYSFGSAQELTGTTGEMTKASGKTEKTSGVDIWGNSTSDTVFTAKTIDQQVIAGDGSTIVNVYYTRKSYTMTFKNGRSTYKTITKKWGADIAASEWPSYNGDANWKLSNGRYIAYQSTMAMGNATLTAVGNDGRANTATYYGEALSSSQSGAIQVSGRWFIVHHTDTTNGTASYTVGEEDRYAIKGFTLIPSMGTQVGDRYRNAKFYYSRNSYNVRYYNGGSEENTATYKYEADISAAGSYTPSHPAGIPAEYIFKGWYKDPAGTQAMDFSGKTMPAEDIIVYAKWAPPTVSGVAYVTMEGENGKTLTITYGETIDQTQMPNPTEPDNINEWEFVGWAIKVGEQFVPFNFNTRIYNNIELYPYYINKNKYSVVYEANGGAGAAPVDERAYAAGSFADVKNGIVAPSGKVFKGWNTAANGTGTMYQPGDKVKIANGDVTLYAIFGEKPTGTTLTYHDNYTGATKTVQSVNNGTVQVLSLDGAGFASRTGYVFKGWSESANGAATFQPGMSIRVDNSSSNDLYAIWERGSFIYTVEYYYDGAKNESATVSDSAEYEAEITTYTNKCPEGYRLDREENFPLTIGADAAANVIRVYYVKDSFGYTVEYYKDGELMRDATENGTAAYNDVITTYPNKCPEGYKLDREENLPLTIGTDVAANVIRVYYVKNEFELTVHYVYDDGSEAKPDYKDTVTCGDPYIVTSPTIDGYVANKLEVAGTMPASNVEETVVYTKRGDLSYTVYYYWNGTQTPVANSKTVSAQVYNARVTESPATVSGYTPVSTDAKSITITTGTNEIIFYYYKNVTLTANSNETKYDGTEKTVSGYKVTAGAQEELTFPGVEASAARIDAGETDVDFDMPLVAVDATNRYIVTATYSGTLKINKRSVTLTSATDDKVYDGTALTNGTVTVTGDGFAEGEGASYNVTGSQTNVGWSDNSFTYELNANTKADNYEIKTETGRLTVTPVTEEVTVTITEHGGNAKYDGKPHEVTGYTWTTNNSLYTEADFAFINDNDRVTGTSAGEYDMLLKPTDFKNLNNNFTKVTFKINDGKLIISKRSVTLTSATDEKVYDGTALINHTVTVTGDGFAEGEGATFAVTGAQTQAGWSDNKFSYSLNRGTDGNNYIITKEVGKLTVNPVADQVTVTIQGRTGNYVYDGAEKIVTGYNVVNISNSLYKAADFTFSGTAEAAGTAASDYPMGLVESQFENISLNFTNVKFVVTDGKLTITARPVTITARNNLGVIFDNQAHGENGYDVTELAAGHTIETVTISGSQTNVGRYENELKPADAKIVDAQGTDVTANYAISYVPGTLEIVGADTVTVTITEHGGNAKYDGTEKTVTGYDVTNISNPLYTENDFTFSGDATIKGTDAGSYDMELKAADFQNTNANFPKVIFVIVDGTLKISKRSVTLTSATEDKVYDGTALTNGTVTVTGDGFAEGEGASYNVTGSQTNVGWSDNSFTYELNANTKADNYEIKTETGRLTVTPVTEEVVVTITEHGGNAKYDGTEKTVTGYDVTNISNQLYTANDFTFSGDATVKGTNAGSYDMELKAADFQNTNANFEKVMFVIEDGKLTIEPMQLTITAATDGKIYDGTELKNAAYSATETAAGDKIDSVRVSGSITNVGEEKNEAEGAKLSNAKGEDVTGNYAIEYQPGKLTITARPVTITAKNNLGVIFDNQAHGENGYDVKGLAAGHKIETVTISGSQTNVGRYENELKPADAKIVDAQGTDVTANYAISYVPGTLEIVGADTVTVTITEHGGNAKYDGTEKTVTGYDVTNISNPLYTENDFTFSGDATIKGTDAGSYDMELKAADFQNTNANFPKVIFVIVDGTLKISKRSVTLTSATEDKVYDGTALTNGTVTVTGDGFAEGEGASYNVTGSQTNVGWSDNSFTYELNANTKADNYEIKTETGKLTVTGDKVIPEKESPAVDGVYKLGDRIPFTITVKNVSDVAVPNVQVEDTNAVILPGTGYRVLNDHQALIDELAVGATVVVNAQHEVTSEDILAATVENTANVTWENMERTVHKTVEDIDDIDTTLTVHKTSDVAEGAKVKLGQVITYTMTVKNDGNVPFAGVKVLDNMNGLNILPGDGYTVTGNGEVTIGGMAVGAQVTIKATYTVMEDDILAGVVRNAVTASGDEIPDPKKPEEPKKPEGGDETDDDTDNVDVTLTVEKLSSVAGDKRVRVGDTIIYTINVTNNGNVTYHNVRVTDALIGITLLPGDGYTVTGSQQATIDVLAVGRSVSLKAQYTVTEEDLVDAKVTNVVKTEADPVPDPKDKENPKTPAGEDEVTNLLGKDVEVTVHWVDGDQFYRPTTPLKVQLIGNNGAVMAETSVQPRTMGTDWKYTFENMPIVDEDGNEIIYTVLEPVAPGNGRYDVAYNGLEVTNTAYVMVTFVNWNGAVLKSERLLLGDSTTEPDDPIHVGHRFTGWGGGEWRNVTRDQLIRAKFESLHNVIEDPDIPLAGGTVQNVGDCFD